MKNKYLLLASATFALASCSSEEIVDLNREDEIKFRASVSYSTSTRGTETTTADFDEFYATALMDEYPDDDTNNSYKNLFGIMPFKKGDDGYFVSDPPYKWSQKMKLIVYAFGYTPKDGGTLADPSDQNYFGEVTLDGDQQTMNNFHAQQNIADQIDLVAAVGNGDVGNAYNDNFVTLQFHHVLTEVQVVAKCDSKTHRVLVKGMKYGNILSQGNYQNADNTWTEIINPSAYEIRYDNFKKLDIPSTTPMPDTIHVCSSSVNKYYHDISKSEGTGSIGYAMFIPQTLTTFSKTYECWEYPDGQSQSPSGKIKSRAQYIAVLIKIDAIDSKGNVTAPKFPVKDENKVPGTDGYGWAYFPLYIDEHPKWEMGYRYIYHIDFTRAAGYNQDGDPILNVNIDFTANVAEWSHKDVFKPEPENKPETEN